MEAASCWMRSRISGSRKWNSINGFYPELSESRAEIEELFVELQPRTRQLISPSLKVVRPFPSSHLFLNYNWKIITRNWKEHNSSSSEKHSKEGEKLLNFTLGPPPSSRVGSVGVPRKKKVFHLIIAFPSSEEWMEGMFTEDEDEKKIIITFFTFNRHRTTTSDKKKRRLWVFTCDEQQKMVAAAPSNYPACAPCSKASTFDTEPAR